MNLKEKFNLNTFQKYFIYFMMYAVIGWLYEVFLEVVVYRWGFTNRGVLFGPYCPVYGVGALLFIFLINPLIKKKNIQMKLLFIPIVFILSGLAATVLELVTSYLCEWTMGSWPWQTYVDYTYNFQGRIALSPSIRFGLGGVLFLYILQPLFVKLTEKVSNRVINKVSIVLGIIVFVDVICTVLL